MLAVPSNQIKVTFIIILPFNLDICDFFLFHIEIERKCGRVFVGGGGGGKGGGQRVCWPPSEIIGGGGGQPTHTPTLSFHAYAKLI